MEAEILQPKITYDDFLDAVELQMHIHGTLHIEPHHAFTPGLYTRSIVNIPPNVWLLSHVHKTEHQFILSKGNLVIFSKDGQMKLYGAPYIGKTRSGTRRLALTTSYVTWTSIHATSIYPKNKTKKALNEAIKEVEAELFANHENVFLIKRMEELAA